MKLTKILFCAAVAAAMIFAAGKASAFPLKLTSLSGSLTVTPSYSALANTNKTKATKVSFTLKDVMMVITNQVFLNTEVTPPAGSYVVYDPFLFITYLTNSSGYSHSLSGIVNITTEDIATKFSGTETSGTETDTTIEFLDIYGNGPDGLFYEFEVYGLGSIKFTEKTNVADKDTMTISGSGADYGAYKGSDDGVSKGSFKLKGTGSAEWSGPYSIFWETN